MENSKLFTALSYFNKYEQNRLRKYILSPYFNQNEELGILFEEIIKYQNRTRSRKDQKPLEVNYLWSVIYSGKKYDDVRFRKLRSDLLKLIEGFLAQEIYENEPLHKASYFLQATGSKKMSKLYGTSINSARRIINSQTNRHSEYYYSLYKIETNYFSMAENELRKKANEDIEEVGNNLDHFYLAEKLKYYCFVLNSRHFFSREYKLLFIDEIISHIEKHGFENVPPVAIYYQIYLMLTETDKVTHYFKFKNLLDTYGQNFPREEAGVLYSHALNYCIRQVNKGNQKFNIQYFELNKELLKNELIFTEGEIAPWHFKNIVTNALRLGEYDWVEYFVDTYKDKVFEKYRENAISYNLAHLYFHQKKYSDVISLLSTVEYDDITYNLGSKTLLIRTYFESDEIDALDSLLESFRIYLGRQDKIPDQRKNNYLGFVRFIKKLSRVIPGDQKAIKKIREEFEKSEGIVSTDEWLKEKIEALEKGR